MTSVPSSEELIFQGEAGRAAVLAHGQRLLTQSARAAAGQAREMLRVDPQDRDALQLLADALRKLGLEQEAAETERQAVAAASVEPALVQAVIAIRERRLNDAEQSLRPHLSVHPRDAAALRLLAEVALQAGARRDAQDLLRQCLAIAPSYESASLKLSSLLAEDGRVNDALAVLDDMLRFEPANLTVLGNKAATLGRIGEHAKAAALYVQLVARAPDNASLWLSLGHLRNTRGDLEGSVGAYRRAAELKPDAGVIWWSLANLKTVRFEGADIATMEAQLRRDDLTEDSRLHLHFALGKAFEDRHEPEASFTHYAAGNALRHTAEGFDADRHERFIDQAIAVLPTLPTAVRRHPEPGIAQPIFVVGMPRAGSTLIEQILASHSAVEGTAELPILPLLVRELIEEESTPYPDVLKTLPEERARELGERYLEAAQVYRKTDKPFFVDKLPNNWLHIGLIARMLPNARIIDARRHPLDCGWSLFKQNFARGQGFSYDLATIGRYYRDYVRMMAAVDKDMPGRVHRVIHERLVAESEAEIRALLAYVGVPFEEGVLRHHENDRAVRTPSAAQVRKPINREGMERWRPFEPWLSPLKEALGEVLDCYPKVPSALS